MSPKVEARRFFARLESEPGVFPLEIALTDEFTCHHLRTVIRAKVGEDVVIVDDQRECTYQATIVALEKVAIRLTLTGMLDTASQSLPNATLAISLIKEQRWDWLLQKATELGVRTIQPLLAERSVIRLDVGDISRKLERWQAVLRSAAEQSEGLFIPEIARPLPVGGYAEQARATVKLLLQERGEGRLPLKEKLSALSEEQSVVFAIGPEGGWTAGEIETFIQAGFEPVSLGSRILRSETAAIAALSALTYEISAR